jgi:type II secretory pathway component PulM
VRDSSLEKILQWIQRSQDQIPGLEVREMTINLNAKVWLVKVTLTRYERIE